MVDFIRSIDLNEGDRQRAKKFVTSVLRPHFDTDLDDRISIMFEVDKYNWKEDAGLYSQALGDKARVVEVYWDGVYVCDAVEGFTTGKLLLRNFFKAFADLYNKDKVVLIKKTDFEKKLEEDMVKQHIKDAEKAEEDKFMIKDKTFKDEGEYIGAKLVEEKFKEIKKKREDDMDDKLNKLSALEVK
jgi:hypothetical protein